jgi:putative transposase
MLYKDNTKAHAVGWSTYHLQWCTKYRYKIFRNDKLKNFCLVAILEAAKRHKIEIEEIDIQADHVHMIAKIPLSMSVSKALNLLKGFSSFLLFKVFQNL